MTPMSEVKPTGRPNARLKQTVRDMVISLIVVLGVIAIVMVIAWRPKPEAVKPVEYRPQLSIAERQAQYPILMLDPVPEGWTVTSARWEATDTSSPDPSWHIGMVTADGQYVQIEQSATKRPEWINAQLSNETRRGERSIDGTTWIEYERDAPVQRSLVLTSAGVTTIVSGTLSFDELATLVSGLR